MITDGRLKEIAAGIDVHDSPFPDDPGAKGCSAEVREMAKELLDRRHGAPSGTSGERATALANAPLRFVMIDGTTIAQPAPGAGRVAPFLDERGHRIGDAFIDGLQVLARVTNAETAEVLRENCGQQGVSLSYQVDAAPAEPRFCPHGYMFGDGRGLGPPIDQASDGCLRRSR